MPPFLYQTFIDTSATFTRTSPSVPLPCKNIPHSVLFANACVNAVPSGPEQLDAIEIGNELNFYTNFPSVACTFATALRVCPLKSGASSLPTTPMSPLKEKPPSASLLHLPNELLLLVAEELDNDALVQLTSTCERLHMVLTPCVITRFGFELPPPSSGPLPSWTFINGTLRFYADNRRSRTT
ncbi:hypothetical protein B0H19DRAFT_1386537 [Mycena capillaripes]|nr:hypothetical protein B0H19DRAFT_1386537 [Mycena capillaripes]